MKSFLKQKKIWFGLGLCLLLLICVCMFFKTSPQGTEGFAGDNDPAFVMYHVEWCGHCKKMKPEFQKLKDSYKGGINIMMINAEDPKYKDVVESQKIESFPTVRFYPKGLDHEYNDYEGERTESGMFQFLNSK